MQYSIHRAIVKKGQNLMILCLPLVVILSFSLVFDDKVRLYIQIILAIALIALVLAVLYFDRRARRIGLDRRFRYALSCRHISENLEKGDLQSALRGIDDFLALLSWRWGTREKLKRKTFDDMELFFNPIVKVVLILDRARTDMVDGKTASIEEVNYFMKILIAFFLSPNEETMHGVLEASVPFTPRVEKPNRIVEYLSNRIKAAAWFKQSIGLGLVLCTGPVTFMIFRSMQSPGSSFFDPLNASLTAMGIAVAIYLGVVFSKER